MSNDMLGPVWTVVRIGTPWLIAATAFAQQPSLNFFKNYFVTGDYIVGGVGLRGLGDASGVARGTIMIDDVPAGADVVGAFLYWQTVEKSQSAYAGRTGT